MEKQYKEPTIEVSEKIIKEVYKKLYNIINPIVSYDDDKEQMMKDVISSNQKVAEDIQELLLEIYEYCDE